jgi:hypothetical protein
MARRASDPDMWSFTVLTDVPVSDVVTVVEVAYFFALTVKNKKKCVPPYPRVIRSETYPQLRETADNTVRYI